MIVDLTNDFHFMSKPENEHIFKRIQENVGILLKEIYTFNRDLFTSKTMQKSLESAEKYFDKEIKQIENEGEMYVNLNGNKIDIKRYVKEHEEDLYNGKFDKHS